MMSFLPEIDDVEQGPTAAVAVYCGSGSGSHPMFLSRARELGALLASLKISLVYGGGDVGMMGAVADAVMSGGGEVIGVIPQDWDRQALAILYAQRAAQVQAEVGSTG